MKLVELLKNAQKSRLQLLLIGLEEKEYFSEIEKAGKSGAPLVIVLEQSDLESNIVSFSKEMLWEDAIHKLSSLKKDIIKQEAYFFYDDSPFGFGYDIGEPCVYEYSIKTLTQARNFARNLHKTGAVDNMPPKGWIKQIRLD